MATRKLSELNDDELAAELKRRRQANKPKTVRIREIEMDEEQYKRLHGKPSDDTDGEDGEDDEEEQEDGEEGTKKGYFKS